MLNGADPPEEDHSKFPCIPYAGITRVRFNGFDLSPFILGTPIQCEETKLGIIYDSRIRFIQKACAISEITRDGKQVSYV